MALSAMRNPGPLSQLDQAVLQLERHVDANPDDDVAYLRLIAILSDYAPGAGVTGRYVDLQRTLTRDYDAETCFAAMTEPTEAGRLMANWSARLREAGAQNRLGMRQIFAGDAIRIGGEAGHCMNRLAFFAAEGVIPQLCYSCYKVQILPADVATLIGVIGVLHGLGLPRNNSRKCMAEVREEVPYPYKGYVYCESEAEAEECRSIVLTALSSAGLTNVAVGVSHGCSEFGLKHPDFKYAKDGAHRAFPRPEIWDRIEAHAFSKKPLPPAPPVARDAAPVLIRDVFAFETWLYVAEAIGDESYTQFPTVDPSMLSDRFKARVSLQADMRAEELAALQERIASQR